MISLTWSPLASDSGIDREDSLIFITEFKMKATPILVQLTIHKVFLVLKFPATLSLELQIDQDQRLILSDTEIGTTPLPLQLQVDLQTPIHFNTSLKEFQVKTLSIIVFIKTKSSPNRLRAGKAQLRLSRTSDLIKQAKTKLLKSHDPSAFLEYSLKTKIGQPRTEEGSQKGTSTNPESPRKRREGAPNIFKSAVCYKTKQMSEPQQKSVSNELKRYLRDSVARQEGPNNNQRNFWSTRKHLDRQSWINDESKTERRSYGYARELEQSLNIRQEQQKMKTLHNNSDYTNREVSQVKLKNQQLIAQNKGLRQKLRNLNDEIDQKNSAIRNLNKKYELKQSNHSKEMQTVRKKLAQAQAQLQEQLTGQSQALNSMEQKEKEWLTGAKEKEKLAIEERKRLTLQAELKEKEIKELQEELLQMKQLFRESQEIVDHLSEDALRNEDKIVGYSNQINNYKAEIDQLRQENTDAKEKLSQKKQKNAQTKALKRQIAELQKKREAVEGTLKQKQRLLDEKTIEVGKFKDLSAEKENTILALVRQNKQKQQKVEELTFIEKQLKTKVYRFENQVQQEHTQSQHVSKQIRTVQMELSKVKLQSQYENATRAKKLSEYQRINQLLNKKIELLAQENIELIEKNMTLSEKFSFKEDQYYDIAQHLVASKENLVQLESEVQILRDERNQLQQRVKELEINEEDAMQLRGEVEHREKLLGQLEQREQVREIQLLNEIKLMEIRKEEREEQIDRLKLEVSQFQQRELSLQGQVESLTYAVKNLEGELELSRQEIKNYRRNNVEFEERMLSLQRTEASSLSSIEQLHEENLNFRLMLKENEGAMVALGKRHDHLFKTVLTSLERFYELLTQSRNIANQYIKHDKVEISTLLNDCLRKIAEERAKHAESTSHLEQELMEQRVRNSQCSKAIKIKTQIQEQLEQDILGHQQHQQLLNSQISNLDSEIKKYQSQLKEKAGEIRELRLEMEGLKKEHKSQLAQKQDTIAGHLRQIGKQSDQIASHIEKHKREEEQFKIKLEMQQQQAQNKLQAAAFKQNQLQNSLKGEKDALKALKAKSLEQDNSIAKLNKEKEDHTIDIEKRTKDLISVRAESEYRYKLVCEKQNEISQMKKNLQKLEKEKQVIQRLRKNLQEGNKALVMTRTQLESSLRQKNNQMGAIKSEKAELQKNVAKLTKNKENLLEMKKSQDQLVRDLHLNIKNLKESLIESESNNAREKKQKEEMEKEHGKKINVLNRQNQNLTKQLQGLKTKSKQVAIDQREKAAELTVELTQARKQRDEDEEEIRQLKKELSLCQAKISTLKSAQKGEFFLPGREKELANLISQLTTLTKGNEAAKKTVMNRNGLPEKKQNKLPQLIKEVITAVSRLKIVVLNRKGLNSEDKLSILEEIRVVQDAAERLSKETSI